MALVSMTGFGHCRKASDQLILDVEVKAVNNRFLDLVFRMPSEYNSVEHSLAKLIRKRVKRGRVEVTVNRQALATDNMQLKFNRDMFLKHLDIVNEAFKISYIAGKSERALAVANILKRREVVEFVSAPEDLSGEIKELESAVSGALDGLCEMKVREGESLEKELISLLDTFEDLQNSIQELSKRSPESFADRLEARMAKLDESVKVDPVRFAQEVALLTEKSDVTEELARLRSHIQQFRQFLTKGGSGRKLEFLLQEMGREVNTSGAKTQSVEVTKQVVEAKGILEKLREQVLNIE